MKNLHLSMALWFLIWVHFTPNTSPHHRHHLYKKAGVTIYKVCSADSELVQVPNPKVWEAIGKLSRDKAVINAGVSIEGTCD